MKYVKDTTIDQLRTYFNNVPLYDHLIPPQLDIDIFNNIPIYDTQPEQLVKFPMIVISSTMGNCISGGIGDMACEIYDDTSRELIAYRYGGMYEFNLTFEVAALSSLEKEVLSDLVVRALRFAIKKPLEYECVFIKSVNYGSDNIVNRNSGNNIYVQLLSVPIWSEWYEDVNLTPITGVNVNA